MEERKKYIPDTKFKPGQSGNPKGRPKGIKDRRTYVRQFLEASISFTNPLTGKKEKRQTLDFMVLSLIKAVIDKADVRAYQELADSFFGKLKEYIDHTTNDKDINQIIIPKNIDFESWDKLTKKLKSDKLNLDANNEQ